MRPMLFVCMSMVMVGCTGEPAVPRNPKPLQLAVRVAEARHADQVEQDIFVWPTAAPTEAPDEAACMWWSGDSRGRNHAARGLHEGRLRWAALVVTRSGIQFGGEDLVALDGAGRLPADQVRDGTIPALGASLRQARSIQDAWFEACGMVYRDRPLLVVEQAVPATTVLAVLRTLSVHRFPRVAALVGDRDPQNRSVDAPDDPGVLAVVRPTGAQVQVMDSLGLRRFSGPTNELESMLAKATPSARFGCALVVPEGDAHWSEVAAMVDTTTAFGAFSALVHSEAEWRPGPEAPAEEARAPTEWLTLDGLAAVHWLDTPEVEAVWQPLTEPVRCDQVKGRVRQRIPVPSTLTLALGSPGEDPVQPCLGPACVPMVQLPPEEGEEVEPVLISYQTFGSFKLPESSVEDSPLASVEASIRACAPPVAMDDRHLARAVGWVEINDQGAGFDAQVGVLEEAYKPWARCVGEALRAWPVLTAPEQGTHAAVQVIVEAQLAPRPEE